jgi:hypothetical protein
MLPGYGKKQKKRAKKKLISLCPLPFIPKILKSTYPSIAGSGRSERFATEEPELLANNTALF